MAASKPLVARGVRLHARPVALGPERLFARGCTGVWGEVAATDVGRVVRRASSLCALVVAPLASRSGRVSQRDRAGRNPASPPASCIERHVEVTNAQPPSLEHSISRERSATERVSLSSLVVTSTFACPALEQLERTPQLGTVIDGAA